MNDDTLDTHMISEQPGIHAQVLPCTGAASLPTMLPLFSSLSQSLLLRHACCLASVAAPSLSVATAARSARGRKAASKPPVAPPPAAPAASAKAAVASAAAAAQQATAASALPLHAPGLYQQEAAAALQHKRAALDETLKRLNKKLGTGTLMRLGEQPAAAGGSGAFECLPSGCLTLDVALGGGWARGRIVEVYGPESSGKTTLALHAIAEVQKAGGQAVFVDAEHAFNKPFARQLGVNVNELIICQPSCGEDALEVVDQVLRSHAVDFVAVDSVSALLPRAELEGAIGDLQVAGQARLMSHGLRKLAANASKTNACVMFINQLRHRVGVFFGSPETTSGGQALKFYASQRVDVRVREKIKGGATAAGAGQQSEGGSSQQGGEIGVRVRAKVVKNKVAPPYRSAEFIIAFNRGIDASETLLEACIMLGVVQVRGSHYYLDEQRLGQGREAVAALLAADAGMRASLTARVRAAMAEGGAPAPLPPAAAAEEEEAAAA